MTYGYVNPTTGFTIEVWFKSNATSTAYRALWSTRTQANVVWTIASGLGRQGALGILPSTSNNAIQMVMSNEGTNSATQPVAFVDPAPAGYASDNLWHHIALRLNSNRMTWTLFLDGAVLAAGNSSVALNWKPSVQTFGADYAPHLGDFGSALWSKWLAYPTVYDKALSDNRILEHYTAGSGGTVYYDDDEVTRLHRICDWGELPEQSRQFEPALVRLQGIQVAGTNALTALQDTAAAASGLVFADGQSRIVYHNRRHSYNRWSVVTLSETLDAAPEVGITFTADDTRIYNDIRGDRPFGSEIRVVDEVSKAAFGRKTFEFTLPVTTHEELMNAVSWIAAKYQEAVVRVSSVSFRAESSDLIEWAATGGLTLGDHITLDELPVDVSPEALMEFIVERISVDVDVKNRVWQLELELSPFQIQYVFQVGVTPLGSTYRVAY